MARQWCLLVCGVLLAGLWGCEPATPAREGVVSDGGVAEKAPETRAAPREGSFRAMTYNVHGLPSGITKDDTNARLKAIGPLIKDFEIIGLQEVFTDDGYAELKPPLEHQTHVRYTDKLKESRFYGPGLLFLAHFASEHRKQALFSQCNGTLDGASDCLASKGFQMVRVKLAEGVELDVYNSHFEAGNGDKDRAARNQNLLELRKAMKEWSAGRALLFLGDTNLHQDREGDKGPLADWIKDIGLLDGCEAVDCPKKGRIDRIFFRSSATLALSAKKWWIPTGFQDAKGTDLSDHEPIVVEFGWKVK